MNAELTQSRFRTRSQPAIAAPNQLLTVFQYNIMLCARGQTPMESHDSDNNDNNINRYGL